MVVKLQLYMTGQWAMYLAWSARPLNLCFFLVAESCSTLHLKHPRLLSTPVDAKRWPIETMHAQVILVIFASLFWIWNNTYNSTTYNNTGKSIRIKYVMPSVMMGRIPNMQQSKTSVSCSYTGAQNSMISVILCTESEYTIHIKANYSYSKPLNDT